MAKVGQGARRAVLDAVTRQLQEGGRTESRSNLEKTADARLRAHRRNLVPDRATADTDDPVALFREMLEMVSATVEHVPDVNAVPEAVAQYLSTRNLPARIRQAPHPMLEAMPWDDRTMLERSSGPARDEDEVSVTTAVAGVAETGTLMLWSGPEGPTTLNLMPDTHVVVLPRDAVVRVYEDAWDVLRQRRPGSMPRTVNLITGPSRTGDIEQTVQLGAHGPRRLHVILVDEAG